MKVWGIQDERIVQTDKKSDFSVIFQLFLLKTGKSLG